MVRLVNPDRQRARNYTSRREQWRLMLLILPLGLVILVMARLRDPQTADRVNQFFASVEQPSTDLRPRPAVAEKRATPVSAPRSLFPGINPELLKSIRDNTYFRNAEKDAWFHFFALLERTPQADLKKMHSMEVDYVQLVDQPNFYRGKLVKLYGFTRQITKQTPAPNELGIKSYYRIVVEPTDDIDWPIFVYALELPPGLKEGDNLMSNMVVTGLFFKKLSFQWKEGMGIGPVIVARTIEDFGAGPGMPGKTEVRPPVAVDRWAETKPHEAAVAESDPTTESTAAFRDILNLAGWSVGRLAEFDDGEEFTEQQRRESLNLLRRLRSFDSASLADWKHDGLWYFEVMRQPDDYRGQLVRLQGRVTNVKHHKLSVEEAQRLEMPEYYECDIVLDTERPASKILTTRVPKAWLEMRTLDEPASASALYLKLLGKGEMSPAVWLAKEVAWHPSKSLDQGGELFGTDIVDLFGKKGDPRFGVSVLGNLDVDVGLLDDIQPRGKIRAEEREAFYQVMKAVGQFAPSVYEDIAKATLPAVLKDWQQRLAAEKDPKRQALAKLAVDRASKGRYSVAPLFNEPESRIGHLIVVEGRARRAVRVEVGEKPGGGQSDIARRFGIDHYYELEVFTDDSQNYPLVFCVRELPEGFPTSGEIDVPVRVAGFFFKDWLYRSRHSGDSDDDDSPGDAGRPQYAPLLIGPEPTMLAVPEQAKRGTGQLVEGVLFVLALASIWGVAVWFARGDRRFRQQTLAANYELPPGESLNDLDLPTSA
jgi:hypothetical protein